MKELTLVPHRIISSESVKKKVSVNIRVLVIISVPISRLCVGVSSNISVPSSTVCVGVAISRLFKPINQNNYLSPYLSVACLPLLILDETSCKEYAVILGFLHAKNRSTEYNYKYCKSARPE
jgi:hypothetical protein